MSGTPTLILLSKADFSGTACSLGVKWDGPDRRFPIWFSFLGRYGVTAESISVAYVLNGAGKPEGRDGNINKTRRIQLSWERRRVSAPFFCHACMTVHVG